MKNRRLVIAPSAERDLDRYWDTIASNNTVAVAQDQIAGLLRTAERLSRFPEMGRLRAQLWPDLRSFPTRTHIIFYRVFDDRLEVVRFVPAEMDIEEELLTFLQTHFRSTQSNQEPE